MTDSTARFGLPFIQPGQAQKEVFHNEALALLDAALHPVAETRGDNIPPPIPAIGQGWIVGTAPTGDWSGQANRLAVWTAGGWRFVAPTEHMRVWVRDAEIYTVWDGAAWMDGELAGSVVRIDGVAVVSAQQAAIADIGGGSVIDAESRAGITAILAVLRAHGLIAT
ncbi:DUF2793 domain-containing protein [Parasphingopyxis sp.]|uniref:DUF2793 domain-containing protein n=1 Tax=Parasphingopyxis sp. TaxID=1920299 RepID=UPI0026374EDB|nr:DUF2793 domain-containing protein [Parasphingopyxis sp.]